MSDRIHNAARAVEAWWIEQGQHALNGAPACIFELRAALAGVPAQQDAPTDDDIEALAKKHVARGADQLRRVMPDSPPYQQTEQFKRIKAMILEALARFAPAQDAEQARGRELLHALVDQMKDDEAPNGDAPGHHHDVPGIWDSDNGKLSGKPCAWCALWRRARAQRAAEGNGDVG